MRYELKWGLGLVRSVRQLTPTVRQIEIAPSTGVVDYAAGSHINVSVLIDGQPDTRSYSLIGETPVDGAYRIAVRCLPDGRGGSLYMSKLKPGDRISLSNPQNLFELAMGRPHYLLFAAGIGITPLIGMPTRLLAIGASFQMVYCGRTRADMPYVAELEQLLGDRLQLAISDEGTRVELTKVFEAQPPETEVYFCGPMAMLEAARCAWRDLDRPASHFRFETFGSSGIHPREAFQVHIQDRNQTVTVAENTTMLDALEDAGIPVMADCKRGECGLCLVNVLAVEGEIDHRDVFLSEEQKREGKQLCICVSRAVGGAITIDSGYRL